jgi:hypothetical protein
MIRKTGMLAAAVVASSLLFAAPAHAEQLSGGCTTSIFPTPTQGKLTATANYTTNGANRTWQSAGFKFTTGQFVTGSGVDIALRTGDQPPWSPPVWSYSSPGGLDSDVQYTVPINVTVPANQSYHFRFHAIFDVSPIPDPSCTAYLS